MTESEIAVVKETVKIDAYRKGHDEFSALDLGPDAEPDLEGFTDSARYANVILPDLRAMAGYADGGHGTHQMNRRIALIPEGNEDDEPAEGILTEATLLADEVIDAWHTGALDGMTDTFDPDSVMH